MPILSIFLEIILGLALGVKAILAAAGFFWGAWSLGSEGFDPLGLSPIRKRLRGNDSQSQGLAIRGPYRYVRHPLYFFVLVAFWSVPRLTADWSGKLANVMKDLIALRERQRR